jgi:hypothetical protein
LQVKNLFIIVTALALAGCGKSADPGRSIALRNGDFEQVANDGSIPGWTLVQHAGPRSYDMLVDAQGAYAGKGSFRMTRIQEQFYGSIKQDVAVGKFVGQRLELSAMLKTRDVGPAGWKLMVLGIDKGEFSSAFTGTSDWQRATLRVQVPNGVSTVSVGAILLDAGTGWLDDVQLKVVAP